MGNGITNVKIYVPEFKKQNRENNNAYDFLRAMLMINERVLN